ncbi:ion channel [Methanobrevibacter sp.]|uniref:ion channel n=1 Tax=Methanobrevibacter sp. TaxID=66852 RepID=UPI003890454E
MERKQVFYLSVIFLMVIDILFLIYITFSDVSLTLRYSVLAFDFILCIVLWIEFIYSYINSDDKKQYMKDNSLSILGMLPFDFIFLRALRLIKLIQFIKLFVLARDTQKAFSKFLRTTYLDKIIFIAILFVFTVTLLVRLLDPTIHDLNTALWYVVVSITSTGYGDVVPVSTSGRIIGIVAMIGGILIFSTVTAVISSIYVSRISRSSHNDLESKIDDLTMEIKVLNEKIDELKNKDEEV